MTSRTTFRRTLFATITVMVGVVWGGTAASAGPSLGAAIGIKGTGSTYVYGSPSANPAASLRVLNPGATSSFTLKVDNTGSVSNTFLVSIDNDFIKPGPITSVMNGATDITASSEGAGYVTPVIQPHTSLLLTVNVAMPAAAAPDTFLDFLVVMSNPAGSVDYGEVIGNVETPTTTATDPPSGSDFTVTTPGGKITADQPPAQTPVLIATPVAAGKTVSFTLKLTNHSTGLSTPTVNVQTDNGQCDQTGWTVDIKYGTTDITAAVYGQTWTGPSLTPNASLALAIKVTTGPSISTGCDPLSAYLVQTEETGGSPAYPTNSTYLEVDTTQLPA